MIDVGWARNKNRCFSGGLGIFKPKFNFKNPQDISGAAGAFAPPGAGSKSIAGAKAPPGAGSESLAGAKAPPGAGSNKTAGARPRRGRGQTLKPGPQAPPGPTPGPGIPC